MCVKDCGNVDFQDDGSRLRALLSFSCMLNRRLLQGLRLLIVYIATSLFENAPVGLTVVGTKVRCIYSTTLM